MNASAIFDALRKGVALVESLGPVAAMVGGPVASVVAVVKGVGEIVENVNTRVKEGAIVLNSQEEGEIQALTARLAAANDELNRRIRAS